ncbi:MAG: polysaccharide biosynthesis protein [Clostridia bacterium]|nr:polysaccharide biosynthesis protein [Clostridia bacterium]
MSSAKNGGTVGKGAIILLLSSVIVKLIGAFFKIPLASDKVLGDLGFGYFSVAYDIFTPIYTVATAGFPVAISKILSNLAAKESDIAVKPMFFAARRLLFTSGIIFSALFALVVLIFTWASDGDGYSLYPVLAVAPSVLFCFAASAYRGYYEGVGSMGRVAASNVIEALGKLILGLGFAYVTVKVTQSFALAATAAISGVAVGSLLAAVYLHLIFKYRQKNNCRTGNVLCTHTVKALSAVFLPIALASLSGCIVSLIDALTVRSLLFSLFKSSPGVLKDSYSQLVAEMGMAVTDSEIATALYGIRSKAYTLVNLVPTFTVAIGISAIPILSQLFAKGDKSNLIKNINSVLKLISVIAFPAGVGMLCMSNRIMYLLYGVDASAEIGGGILRIYSAAVIFAGFTLPVGCALQAVGRQRTVLVNVIIGVGFKLAGNIILCSVPQINVYGAVYSTVICYGVMLALHLLALLRLTGSLPDKNSVLIKPFVAACLCGIAAYSVAKLSDSSVVTALAIIIAAVVYVVCLLLFNTFKDEEIADFPFGNQILRLKNKKKMKNFPKIR